MLKQEIIDYLQKINKAKQQFNELCIAINCCELNFIEKSVVKFHIQNLNNAERKSEINFEILSADRYTAINRQI